jgi:hypothetical protein
VADRDEYVPDSLVRLLGREVRGFAKLDPRDQTNLAYLVWIEGQNRREHRLFAGFRTFTHTELEKRFGRGGFRRINDAVGVFEVTPNWSKDQGATRGYRLMPAVRELKDRYLKPRRIVVTKLMTMDGRAMRTVPAAVSSKGLNGVTATAWRRAKIHNKIPVDVAWMQKARDWIDRALEGQQPADLFAQANHEDLTYRAEVLGQLLRISHTDVAGRGYIIHRYAEATTGRLYARGVSLQTVPRLIRKAALHGLYEYDIENCHYAVFSQMAAQFGVECHAVNRYLVDKSQTRTRIAESVGIEVDQAKVCLLALMYGARLSMRPDNAIPEAIGVEKARRLYADPTFAAIAKDLREGRTAILKGWPRRRRTLLNAMGKPIGLKEPAEDRLAHLIQGVEAQALRSIVELYPEEVVLLMHDGFVATRSLDVPLMERRMFDATGYRLTISGGVIHIPANLEFSNM